MSVRRFSPPASLWLGAGIVMVLGGLLLLFIGLGTALDYMVAQSHPVGATEALLLRAEYTAAGVFFVITGFGLARQVSGSSTAASAERP